MGKSSFAFRFFNYVCLLYHFAYFCLKDINNVKIIIKLTLPAAFLLTAAVVLQKPALFAQESRMNNLNLILLTILEKF
jgi:hypothetical protein